MNADTHWDDLRYVLAIVRTQTLSRAADALGVSHTTVGRRLRALEQRLGVLLFNRTPDGLIPTPAGQDIADVAARMEDDVLALEGRVLGRDARLRGALRVSTMDIVFHGCQRAFVTFAERYPSVELTVASSDREVSLARREADVVLRLNNAPPEHLVGRKLGRVEFAVYASRALAASIGADAPYAAYPWLHWDERLGMQWLDAWLAEHAPGAQVAMRIDVSALLLRQMVAAGIGVHFLACFDADPDPELVRIGPIQPEFGRDLWMLTHADLRHTPRVKVFMDHMTETLKHEGVLASP